MSRTQVLARTGVKRDVVVSRADPVDIREIEHMNSSLGTHRDPGQMLSSGCESFDERQHAIVHSHALSLFHAHSGAGDGGRQAFGLDGLQNVVERVHLERAQGILVVRGHEDDDRNFLRRHRLK